MVVLTRSPAAIRRRRKRVKKFHVRGIRAELIAQKLKVSTITVRRDFQFMNLKKWTSGVHRSRIRRCLLREVLQRKRTFGATVALGVLRSKGLFVQRSKMRAAMKKLQIEGPTRTIKRRLAYYDVRRPMETVCIDQNEFLGKVR